MFKVIFTDGTTYTSKEYTTVWTTTPDKTISGVFAYLPKGGALYLPGAEQYLYFIELTYGICGEGKGNIVPRFQYLRGKFGEKVLSYRITLWEDAKSKHKIGDITTRIFEWGKDDNGNPSRGWKKGIL
jgi:hypothetical protein